MIFKITTKLHSVSAKEFTLMHPTLYIAVKNMECAVFGGYAWFAETRSRYFDIVVAYSNRTVNKMIIYHNNV